MALHIFYKAGPISLVGYSLFTPGCIVHRTFHPHRPCSISNKYCILKINHKRYTMDLFKKNDRSTMLTYL
ncbi:hypothetical protein [Terrimonas sp.]|uniref:hypothetical protein n=1 Tax=Terrimonas sp. TaxID=1914338 RepID=UPI0010570F78|nr:hypothetical protein [Terrimonas sp.]